MEDAATTTRTAEATETGGELRDRLREAAQAPNTRSAYAKAWRCYRRWCAGEGLSPWDADEETVANFFIGLATAGSPLSGRTVSANTLRLYRAALNYRYRDAGRDSPASGADVDEVLRGLARLRSTPPRRVKALCAKTVFEMVELCSGTPLGLRDGAMLALGFAAALRRSELCALRVGDMHHEGHARMTLVIRRSKTDQTGEGQRVAVLDGVAIRPITRVREWLAASGIDRGYVFQTLLRGGRPSGRPVHDGEVARIVKRYAAKVGLDPADYSGHSLRAGFVTSAAAHRAQLHKIMEVTRHRNPATLMRYIRDADSFSDHAGAAFM